MLFLFKVAGNSADLLRNGEETIKLPNFFSSPLFSSRSQARDSSLGPPSPTHTQFQAPRHDSFAFSL